MARPDAWKSDILVSALLALLAAYLEFQPPFERHLVPETLPRVSYPHKGEQTFPTWTLPFLGVIIPASIILAASLARTDSVARSRATRGSAARDTRATRGRDRRRRREARARRGR